MATTHPFSECDSLGWLFNNTIYSRSKVHLWSIYSILTCLNNVSNLGCSGQLQRTTNTHNPTAVDNY